MNLLRKFASEINNKLILKKYENENLQSRNYAFYSIATMLCRILCYRCNNPRALVLL